MSSVQLISIKNGQCLSAPGPYGAAMMTAACDNNDAKQKINISNWNTSDKVQLSTNNAKIDTWQGVVYNSNECGRGNDCDFLMSNTVGNVGVGNGPFRFRGWGAGDNWAYPDGSGKIVQNNSSPNSTDTWWLTLDEKNDCVAYGIPLHNCSPQNRKDCGAYNNYLRDTCKPTQCTTSKNIGDPICQAYCVANPGACDIAVNSYCAANPNDTNFCGCYNLQKYNTLLKLLGANAQTWIPRCSAQECAVNPGAYMTQNMLQTKCSDQQICLQSLTVDASTSQLNDIVQSCSQKSSSNASSSLQANATATTSSSSTSPSSTLPSSTSTSSDSNELVAIGIGGTVLAVLLSSIAVAFIISQRTR